MPRNVPIDRIGACLRWALPGYRADRSEWIIRRLAEPLGRSAEAEIVAAELLNESGEYRAVAVAIRRSPATAELLVLQIADLGPDGVRCGEPSTEVLANGVLAPVLKRLGDDGVRFLQANCDDDDRQATVLTAAGFERIADVAVMSLPKERFASAGRRLGVATTGGPPQWLPLTDLGDRGRATLLRVLAETFVESQDCPKLNRFLAGDRWAEAWLAEATFDPRLTSLLRDGRRWAGCLLLSRQRRPGQPEWSPAGPLVGVADPPAAAAEAMPDGNSLPEAIELVYMGVIPSRRGRGWGRLAVGETVRVAEAVGVGRVVLAVDLRNRPAVSIYRRSGWSEMLRESVWGIGI